MGADALLGGHVDVRPELGVRPELDHRGVERAVRGADLPEAVEVAGVAAVVDAVLLPGDDPGRPQGVLGVAQPAPAEVPGRGGGEGEAADAGRLVPVQLPQPAGGKAPVFEVGAHAQRHREDGVRAGQRLDGRHVQVVVVVVGDDDDVDGAEGGQGQRDRVQTLGPGEGERGAALAPHRVEEHALPVDLGEHAGVAHPGQPQSGGGRPGEVGQGGGVHRDRAPRGPGQPRLLVEVDLGELLGRPGGPGPCGTAGVLEDAVAEVGRSADAGHARATRVRAEGRGPRHAEPGTRGTESGHGTSRWSASGDRRAGLVLRHSNDGCRVRVPGPG